MSPKSPTVRPRESRCSFAMACVRSSRRCSRAAFGEDVGTCRTGPAVSCRGGRYAALQGLSSWWGRQAFVRRETWGGRGREGHLGEGGVSHGGQRDVPLNAVLLKLVRHVVCLHRIVVEVVELRGEKGCSEVGATKNQRAS